MPYLEVGQAVAAVHARSRCPLPALALKFMILTATRSSGVRGTTWSKFDLDVRTWTISAGRMKAKRAHRVPLSGRAMAVLDEARALGPATGDALVFPGTSKGRPLAGATLLNLLERAGFDTTLQGFRSAFAVWARERTNVPSAVAEAALVHTVKNAAEAAYARTEYFDKRADLMELWARHIGTAASMVAIEDSGEGAISGFSARRKISLSTGHRLERHSVSASILSPLSDGVVMYSGLLVFSELWTLCPCAVAAQALNRAEEYLQAMLPPPTLDLLRPYSGPGRCLMGTRLARGRARSGSSTIVRS